MLAEAVTASRRPAARPPWWMAGLAAAFAGYYGLLIHSDLNRPEPAGFVFDIHDGAMILTAVVPESPAARVGLAAGDRIRRVNRQPIDGRLAWRLIEANLRAGQTLRLDLERTGQTPSVNLPLSRAPPSFWLTTVGATLLITRGVQMITLLLAFLVAFKRPFDRSARVGAWVMATLAVYSIALPYQIAATWRALPTVLGVALWVPFVSSLAVPALILTFFAAFPRPIIRSPWAWAAVWAPQAAALVPELQFAFRAVYQPEETSGLVDWTTGEAVVTTLYTVGAVVVLVFNYRRLSDITERRRIRVLVLGSIVGLASLLPIVVGFWRRPVTALGDSVFSTPIVALGAILGLVFPASFAYAILRHRLFDIAFIVRRGLQYALARRVVVSIVPVVAALFLADLWLHRGAPLADALETRGWSYLLLAAVAGVARVQRDRWLGALDRRFFRERYGAERVLRRIGEEARAATSLEDVAPRVVVEIDVALHPTFVALLLRRPAEPALRVASSVPTAARVERLASSSKIAGLLKVLQRPLQVLAADQVGLLRQLPTHELEWIRQSGVELLVPIQLHGEATDALFALGSKRSEEPYSAEDEDLLMAIGDSLAFVLARETPAARESNAFEECPDCGACYGVDTAHCSHDGIALNRMPFPRLMGGRYRLDRRVGQGGMGTVYAAFDAALLRPVAVKLLREDFVGGRASEERFRSEARLSAGLIHPNVVTVHDFGVTAEGRAFIVMELLEGATLRNDLQQEGKIKPPRVMSILRDVAAAVDAAHQRSLIHRDLKPENIFLCRRDGIETAKVLDFGLARSLETPTGLLTTRGLVAGTPDYMAPEHWRGADPSPDWDLWALSVIAFELITGRRPFVADATGPPRFDCPLTADLPTALSQLFSRALAVEPLSRPTTAREFVDELDQAVMCEATP